MMIVRYTGPREHVASAGSWVQLIPGMEGLLVDGTADRPRIIWREILVQLDPRQPWQLHAYMSTALEIPRVEVIGYATALAEWKQTHAAKHPSP